MGYPPVGGISPATTGPADEAPEFADIAARDKFFKDNPDELRDGVSVVVDTVPSKTGAQLQRWSGSDWINFATFIKGRDGVTPTINSAGNWVVDGKDTGVKARSDNGVTPRIGTNGNWWIGQTDTGVKAGGDQSNAVTQIALNGMNQLVITHADTAKHTIQLPSGGQDITPLKAEIAKAETQMKANGVDIARLKSQLGTLDHEVSGLHGVFSYRGTGLPVFPAGPKAAYFINLHNSTASTLSINSPLPSSGTLEDGAVMFVNNENTTAPVDILPESGYSVDQATKLTIQPLQYAMLVLSGKSWNKISSGYIPISQEDLTHRVAAALSGQLHTKDQITAMSNNWLASPSTGQALDALLSKLGYTKGSAPDPAHGGGTVDTTQVKIGVGDTYPTDLATALGTYGSHSQLVAPDMSQGTYTGKKVWIAVPSSVASRVIGMSVNGGMSASWASQEVQYQGAQWTVFITPSGQHGQHLEFNIKWGI